MTCMECTVSYSDGNNKSDSYSENSCLSRFRHWLTKIQKKSQTHCFYSCLYRVGYAIEKLLASIFERKVTKTSVDPLIIGVRESSATNGADRQAMTASTTPVNQGEAATVETRANIQPSSVAQVTLHSQRLSQKCLDIINETLLDIRWGDRQLLLGQKEFNLMVSALTDPEIMEYSDQEIAEVLVCYARLMRVRGRLPLEGIAWVVKMLLGSVNVTLKHAQGNNTIFIVKAEQKLYKQLEYQCPELFIKHALRRYSVDMPSESQMMALLDGNLMLLRKESVRKKLIAYLICQKQSVVLKNELFSCTLDNGLIEGFIVEAFTGEGLASNGDSGVCKNTLSKNICC